VSPTDSVQLHSQLKSAGSFEAWRALQLNSHLDAKSTTSLHAHRHFTEPQWQEGKKINKQKIDKLFICANNTKQYHMTTAM